MKRRRKEPSRQASAICDDSVVSGHRASNPKRFQSSWQRLFNMFRWLTDRLQSRPSVRIPLAPPSSPGLRGFSSAFSEIAPTARVPRDLKENLYKTAPKAALRFQIRFRWSVFPLLPGSEKEGVGWLIPILTAGKLIS